MNRPRRRLAPGERRAELLHAMLEVFREKGVSNTAVSDIVKHAGVAQGTFYLYFDSKDDAICAVVAHMLEDLFEEVRAAAESPDLSALEKLLVLRDALLEMSDEPHEIELTSILHAPQNRALHDRATEEFSRRIVPVLERIIKQGVEENTFAVDEPRVAAWFVLGGFLAYELSLDSPEGMRRTFDQLTVFILRGLGYEGDPPLVRS